MASEHLGLSERWRRLADDALEETALLSWTSIGYRSRLALWAWAPPPPLAPGSVALVTGASRGIGRAAASLMAGPGVRLLLVGRDGTTLARAAGELRRASGAEAEPLVADLGSLESVHALAQIVLAETLRLDVLVHNAGTLRDRRELSSEGIERTVAEHVVGPHRLTRELEALLVAARGCVVFVSSAGMYAQPLDVDRLEIDLEGFRPAVAYARAKRAQAAIGSEWDHRLARHGAHAYVMHPGWVDSRALHEGLPRFSALMRPLLRSPEAGADTIAWLAATRPDGPSGFYLDRRPRAFSRLPGRGAPPGEAHRLWMWCERAARCDSLDVPA